MTRIREEEEEVVKLQICLFV